MGRSCIMVKKTSGKTQKGLGKKRPLKPNPGAGVPTKTKKLDVIGKPKGAAKALDKAKTEKTGLADEAIANILEGISKPEFQNGVKAYIPKGWKEKYKESLGPYKKFLREHPDRFAVVEHDAFNFTIMKVGEEAPKPKKQKKKMKMPWAKMLLKAFMEWCKVTPRSERSFAEFMAAIPTDKEPKSAPDNTNEAGDDEETDERPEPKTMPAPDGEKPTKKKKKTMPAPDGEKPA